LEDWNRVLTVNATGTFLCTQAFLPGMLERRWGRVVNIASVAGLRGGKYIAAYSAAKHAVVGFTRSLAAEVAGSGVTVNAVCPGYVDTDMTRESVARIATKTGMSPPDALRGARARWWPAGLRGRPAVVPREPQTAGGGPPPLHGAALPRHDARGSASARGHARHRGDRRHGRASLTDTRRFLHAARARV